MSQETKLVKVDNGFEIHAVVSDQCIIQQEDLKKKIDIKLFWFARVNMTCHDNLLKFTSTNSVPWDKSHALTIFAFVQSCVYEFDNRERILEESMQRAYAATYQNFDGCYYGVFMA